MFQRIFPLPFLCFFSDLMELLLIILDAGWERNRICWDYRDTTFALVGGER